MRSAWQRALDGQPKIVAWIGKARLGKTRSVQEFNHWQNATQDPEACWPDALPRTDDSLEVNPTFMDRRITVSIPHCNARHSSPTKVRFRLTVCPSRSAVTMHPTFV